MFHNLTPNIPNSHCHTKLLLKKRKQSGSALVMAVFIIIVMSLLGATLVNMLDSSQEGVAYEVLGTRAYTAAQSGLQWQLSQVFPLQLSGATATSVNCASQALIDANTPTFNNVDGLSQCSIRVSCTDFVHANVTYYTITSTGQCAANPNSDLTDPLSSNEITSRTLQVEARSM